MVHGFNEGSKKMYWRRIWEYICISMNLLQIFVSQQNYTFRGSKSVSNMSFSDEATWLTSNWPIRFIFENYPWIPLNGLKNRGFSKILEIFWRNKTTIIFIYICFILHVRLSHCRQIFHNRMLNFDLGTQWGYLPSSVSSKINKS